MVNNFIKSGQKRCNSIYLFCFYDSLFSKPENNMNGPFVSVVCACRHVHIVSIIQNCKCFVAQLLLLMMMLLLLLLFLCCAHFFRKDWLGTQKKLIQMNVKLDDKDDIIFGIQARNGQKVMALCSIISMICNDNLTKIMALEMTPTEQDTMRKCT